MFFKCELTGISLSKRKGNLRVSRRIGLSHKKVMVSGPLAAEYIAREGDVLVPALTHPARPWFGPNSVKDRDILLISALAAAGTELKEKCGDDMSKWT